MMRCQDDCRFEIRVCQAHGMAGELVGAGEDRLFGAGSQMREQLECDAPALALREVATR